MLGSVSGQGAVLSGSGARGFRVSRGLCAARLRFQRVGELSLPCFADSVAMCAFAVAAGQDGSSICISILARRLWFSTLSFGAFAWRGGGAGGGAGGFFTDGGGGGGGDCYNGNMDGTETGVDCGGSCEPCPQDRKKGLGVCVCAAMYSERALLICRFAAKGGNGG